MEAIDCKGEMEGKVARKNLEVALLAQLAQAYLTRRPKCECCILVNCHGRLTTLGTKARPASNLKGHNEKKKHALIGVGCTSRTS